MSTQDSFVSFSKEKLKRNQLKPLSAGATFIPISIFYLDHQKLWQYICKTGKKKNCLQTRVYPQTAHVLGAHALPTCDYALGKHTHTHRLHNVWNIPHVPWGICSLNSGNLIIFKGSSMLEFLWIDLEKAILYFDTEKWSRASKRI